MAKNSIKRKLTPDDNPSGLEPKRVVAVVQSRMGSHRLFGKAMEKLGGIPILELILRRVQKAVTITEVVLATTELLEDQVLCKLAESLQLSVVRGPELDVLGRLGLAAKLFDAEVVVRVTGDNPFVAPEELDRVVEHHLRTGADYSFNHIPALGNGYPDGLGAEVVERSTLEQLNRICTEPAHREHVTAYIWDNPEKFNIETVSAPPSIVGPDIKLDIDTPRDLAHLQQLVVFAPTDIENWSAEKVVRAYRSEFAPELHSDVSRPL
jgi:spore coat polysaccharide biosynthesis protein SpsF